MKNSLFCLLATVAFLLTVSSPVLAQKWVFEHKPDAIVNGSFDCQFFEYIDSYGFYAPTFFDWNKDGLIDIFIGSIFGDITYWQNTGTPDAPCYELITTNFGGFHSLIGKAAPCFGDLNGDGLPELVCGTDFEGGIGGFVSEYRNIGDIANPKFELVEDTIAGVDVYDASVPYLVDLDSNGTLDLFMAGGLGMVVYVKNIGTPQMPIWGTPVTILSDGAYRRAPVVVDIDCDGKLELLISEAYGSVTLYENTSTNPDTAIWVATPGMFAGIDFCPSLGGCFVRPAVADIDNDGDLDWLFGAGQLQLYRNISLDPCDPQLQLEQPGFPLTIGSGYASYYRIGAFFDIDGDGLQECFLPSNPYGVRYWDNIGTVSEPNWVFQTNDFFGNGKAYNQRLQFFDADNDDDWDAMAINDLDKIVLLRNQSGTWEEEFDSVFNNVQINSYVTGLLVGDFNEDGLTDLLMSGGSGGKLFHFIDTDTSTGISWVLQTEYFLPSLPNFLYSPIAFDLDRDGKVDILFGYATKLYWYRNTGSGFDFDLAIIETTGTDGYITLIADPIADSANNCGPEFFSGNLLYVFKGIQPEIQLSGTNIFPSIDTLIQLTAVPFDTVLGMWSGDGVNHLGQFNPKLAGPGTHLIFYTYTDPYYGCTHLTDTIALVVQTVSTHAQTDEIFTVDVFPNPTDGNFTVAWSGEPVDFHSAVFNAQGQFVLDKKGSGTSLEMNLSGAASGIYFVFVRTEGFTAWKKVVVE